MRRSAMLPGNPWTLLITLEDDPDSLGCLVVVQELTMDGTTANFFERHFSSAPEALRAMEMDYGIGPDDWLELG